MKETVIAILLGCCLLVSPIMPYAEKDDAQETVRIAERTEDELIPPQVYSQEKPEEGDVQGEIVEEEAIRSDFDEMHCIHDCLLTAYCNCSECCDEYAGGPTCTGTMPEEGRTVAVDPSVIPLGSRVLINGNWYIAEDTGGWIHGDHIDVYVNDHDAGNEFGRQWADIFWVEE